MAKKNYYPYLFSFGHLSSDINQGALSAILPFLIAAYHYDYGTAALLVMVANIVGSVVQPLFGTLADRRNLPWIMSVGLLLAGGGMAATGFAGSFPLLCACVMVSGIGIAMFHPQAALLVGKTSSEETKGTSISIFSFGGSVGFTLGLAVSIGGIVAPLLGKVGDAFGLVNALLAIFIISVLPLAVSFFLSDVRGENG